jgi:hypothetical protein
MNFYRNPMWNRVEMLFGVVMIVISGVSFFKGLSVGIFQLIVGVMLIVLNVTFWTKPIVTIGDHEFKLKASPFSARYVVQFSDVLELERPSDRQAHLWVRNLEKRKKVPLPLQVLSPDDRESLMTHIRNRMVN